MRQTNAAEKTEVILATARKLFFRQGFEKTTMEEIARAIPMSKATLYKVFANKDEIMLSLCKAHAAQLDKILAENAEAAKSNYLACAIDMLKIMALAIYDEASNVHNLETLSYVSAQLRDSAQAILASRQNIFRSVLQKAFEQKEIKPDADLDQVCEVVLAAITAYLPPYNRHFSVLHGAKRPRLETFIAELNTLTDILYHGLKRQAHAKEEASL